MPRFHLHVYNRIGTACDEEGEELPDLAAAERHAVEGVRSILSEEVRGGSIDLRGHIDIATSAGEVLRCIRFREAVQVYRDPGE